MATSQMRGTTRTIGASLSRVRAVQIAFDSSFSLCDVVFAGVVSDVVVVVVVVFVLVSVVVIVVVAGVVVDVLLLFGCESLV